MPMALIWIAAWRGSLNHNVERAGLRRFDAEAMTRGFSGTKVCKTALICRGRVPPVGSLKTGGRTLSRYAAHDENGSRPLLRSLYARRNHSWRRLTPPPRTGTSKDKA